MATVTATDETLLREVVASNERVDVVDSEGLLIGFFTPLRVQKTPEHILKSIDLVEFERRRHLPTEGAVPTAQMLEWLKELSAEEDRRVAAGQGRFSTEEGMAYFRSLREAYFERRGTPKA